MVWAGAAAVLEAFRIAVDRTSGDADRGTGEKYTAKFKAHEYTITYVLDGGTNDAQNPAKYTVEDEAYTLKAATKNGYTFKGWFTDEEFVPASEIAEIPPASHQDLTLYAKFEINTYTVKLNLNDGVLDAADGWTLMTDPNNSSTTWYEKKFTVKDEDFTLPAATRTYTGDSVENGGDEYTFDGWKLGNDAPATLVTIDTETAQDYTFDAIWTLNMYEVNFYDSTNGETPNAYALDTLSNVKNRAVNTQDEPSYDEPTGYDFVGWKLGQDGEAKTWSQLTNAVTSNLNYYAVYEKETYTVQAAEDWNDFFTLTLPAENGGKATYGSAYSAKVGIAGETDLSGYTWKITVYDEDGDQIGGAITTVAADGTFTIPVGSITQNLEIKVEAEVAGMTVTVNDYNGTGISLVRVSIPSAVTSAKFKYGDGAMYVVDKYREEGKTVYAYLVPTASFAGLNAEVLNNAAKENVQLAAVTNTLINRNTDLEEDVNDTSVVDYADITVAFQSFKSVLGGLNAAYIPYYLRADVNGDGFVTVVETNAVNFGDVAAIYEVVFGN